MDKMMILTHHFLLFNFNDNHIPYKFEKINIYAKFTLIYLSLDASIDHFYRLI